MKSGELKRLLVIDDDDDVLAYLSALLSDQGFEVDTANNGAEAMEKVKTRRPDLITLDMVMPQNSGGRFYSQIKDDPECAGIPVIIVSGLQAKYEDLVTGNRSAYPPDGYISKPFDQDKMLDTINTVLSRSAR